MKPLATLSTLGFLVFAVGGAVRAEAVVTKGDGTCDAKERPVAVWEVKEGLQDFCKQLGEWDIIRLANGGSLGGTGYKCEVKEKDTRQLGGTLCMKAPKLTAPVGLYAWSVKGESRGFNLLKANGTCSNSRPSNTNRVCTWVVTDAAQRKITMAWDNGAIKDFVALSADGQRLEGTSQAGSVVATVRAVREVEASKSVEHYAWTINGVDYGVTSFRKDPVCSNTNMPGVSCSNHVTDKERRQVTLTWGNGTEDLLTMSADAKFLEGKNQKGDVIRGTRM